MKGSKKQSQTSALSVPGVDLGQLERLLSFMTDHGLEEFEYAHGDLRIRLKKAVTPPSTAPSRALLAPQEQETILSGTPAPARSEIVDAAVPAQSSQATPASPAVAAEALHIVKSPIVGTFYAGPNPESEPFVKLGEIVTVGQTLCIIEAMKLMNEIEADINGAIESILVENGHPVEYGEPLFTVRPAAKNK